MALIEQDREHRSRRQIGEALTVEEQQQHRTFRLAQSQWRPWATPVRERGDLPPRQTITRAVDPGPSDRQGHARRGDADLGTQFSEHGHHPVNSCSSIGSPSKVHSFFWASMIAVARTKLSGESGDLAV